MPLWGTECHKYCLRDEFVFRLNVGENDDQEEESDEDYEEEDESEEEEAWNRPLFRPLYVEFPRGKRGFLEG